MHLQPIKKKKNEHNEHNEAKKTNTMTTKKGTAQGRIDIGMTAEVTAAILCISMSSDRQLEMKFKYFLN